MSFFKRLAGLNQAEERIAITNTSATAQSQVTPWLDADYEEGQLAIDVYQTKDSIIIKSTIAGVRPHDIDISINNDMLTIRGKREMAEAIADEDYFYQECYWGSFSRSIILPVEVKTDAIDATIENGVLTVTLPKAHTAQQITVKVKD